MTTIIRRKPSSIFDSVNDLMSDFLVQNPRGLNKLTTEVPVNIVEDDKSFHLEAYIPGVNKEEVDIQLDKNIMTLSFNKETSEEKEEKNYLRREYSVSCFERRFSLPKNIDVTKISASFEQGVLLVNLPKMEEDKGTDKLKIEVK